MVENRDLGWVEHLLYRCISDFANSARAEYFSTFCISVSLLIEDLASQLLSMIRGLDKLVPEQHVAKKLSRSTICKVCKKIYENNLKKVIGHSLSVYHLKRRRLPWKLVENKCTKSQIQFNGSQKSKATENQTNRRVWSGDNSAKVLNNPGISLIFIALHFMKSETTATDCGMLWNADSKSKTM